VTSLTLTRYTLLCSQQELHLQCIYSFVYFTAIRRTNTFGVMLTAVPGTKLCVSPTSLAPILYKRKTFLAGTSATEKQHFVCEQCMLPYLLTVLII
jgi:hypothetical protein